MDSRTALANAITSYVELENEHRTRYRTLLAALRGYLEDNRESVEQLAKGVSWLEFREAFEKRIDVGDSLLELLHQTGIHIRDVRPDCDIRKMTKHQRHAIKQLGGDAKPYTYSEAERIIQLLQRKDSREPRRTKRQRQSPTGTQVHQQRTGHL